MGKRHTGSWTAQQNTALAPPSPPPARCDFCGVVLVDRTVYHARERRITVLPRGETTVVLMADVDPPPGLGDGTTYVFAPDWYACPPCRALIDARDRAGLLDHAQRQGGRRDEAATVVLMAAHDAFFRALPDGSPDPP